MQRNKPVIIAAVILGLLAIGLTVMSLVGGGSAPPPAPVAVATPQPRTTQVVANRLIPARTLITRAMVREEESTDTSSPLEVQAVVGKLASNNIQPGDVIKPDVLTDPIKRVKPANFAIPTGLRAIAVMIDATQTNGDIVDVGDHVDVIVVHALKWKNAASGQDGELKSGRTIAQNLVVLATDPALKQVPTPVPAPAGQPGAPPPTPTPPPPPPPPGTPVPKLRVLLAAPPAEAARIAAAQEQGHIHLTLRDPNSGDESVVPEALEYPVKLYVPAARPRENSGGGGGGGRVTRQTFNTDYAQPSPPQLPPMPATGATGATGAGDIAPAGSEVTVIRGTEKTRVLVPQN